MKKALIIAATAALTAASLLCIAALLVVFNAFGLRDGLTASTGWFYPKPADIDDIGSAESMWGITLPEGSYIEELYTEKPFLQTNDLYYIRYKPYCYYVRIVIPKEETDSFVAALSSVYTDCEEEKACISFPTIICDIDKKEFTHYFVLSEDAVTKEKDKGFVELTVWKSVYITEQEDKTTVLLTWG